MTTEEPPADKHLTCFEASIRSCLDSAPLSAVCPLVFVVPVAGIERLVFDTAKRILSQAEYARLDCFADAQDALQYAAARILVRLVLGKYAGYRPDQVPLLIGSNGRPRVAIQCGFEFSISHCDGWVAVAVARDANIGVDIETFGKPTSFDYEEIARRHFSESEYLLMKNGKPTRKRVCFTELWTLKEAYLKALGRGLNKPLKECRFSFEENDQLSFHDTDPAQTPEDWRFELYGIGAEVRIAVAMSQQRENHVMRTRVVQPLQLPAPHAVDVLRSNRMKTADVRRRGSNSAHMPRIA